MSTQNRSSPPQGARKPISPIALVVIGVLSLAPAYGFFQWFLCRIEVPEGHFAVLLSKTGENLPSGQILALNENQKGIQLGVLPEGRHFRNPFFWDWSIQPLTRIEPGHVGVLTRLYGQIPSAKRLRSGLILVPLEDSSLKPASDHVPADQHQRGIVEEVLEPGRAYRLNPSAYSIVQAPAIEIGQGFVGVVTNLHGPIAKNPNAYLVAEGEKGVQALVLQPGKHYLNPFAKQVSLVNIQSQRFELQGREALVFPSQDGFDLKVLLTVEWSVDRQRAPEVKMRFGVGNDDHRSLIAELRRKVLIPTVRGYGRIEGSKFPAIDYISGETRLLFQRTLEEKIKLSCEPKGVLIHSVLINDILPPQELAAPIRERELAKEELTRNEAQRRQAVAEQKLAVKEEQIKLEEAHVRASTEKIKKEIEARNRQTVALRQQEARQIEAQQALTEARLKASAIRSLGKAEADVIQLKGVAEGEALARVVDAFGEASSYAAYVFALRAGPAIDTVLAGTGSSFGRLFEELVRANQLPAKTRADQPTSKVGE